MAIVLFDISSDFRISEKDRFSTTLSIIKY